MNHLRCVGHYPPLAGRCHHHSVVPDQLHPPILADGDFGIAAGVGVAARLTVMLTLLGLMCLATNSVILPYGYPVTIAKQLATLDVLLG